MNRRFLSLLSICALVAPAYAFAADDDTAPADKPAVEKPAGTAPAGGGAPAPRGGGFGGGGIGRFGGGGFFGGAGGAGAMLDRDPLREIIALLGELNLSPGFSLTQEQKEKIQAVRDEYQKQLDAWRAEHEKDLKKLQDDAAALRGNFAGGGGGQDTRAKFQEIARARETLMATAPKSDDAYTKIKAILNEDQLKKFDLKQAEHQAEMDKAREDARSRFGQGGGFGGGGGGFGQGANGGNRRGAGGAAQGQGGNRRGGGNRGRAGAGQGI